MDAIPLGGRLNGHSKGYPQKTYLHPCVLCFPCKRSVVYVFDPLFARLVLDVIELPLRPFGNHWLSTTTLSSEAENVSQLVLPRKNKEEENKTKHGALWWMPPFAILQEKKRKSNVKSTMVCGLLAICFVGMHHVASQTSNLVKPAGKMFAVVINSFKGKTHIY